MNYPNGLAKAWNRTLLMHPFSGRVPLKYIGHYYIGLYRPGILNT
jgi:hypothetical protein